MLEAVAQALEGRLPADRPVMRQGELPRTQLLERLRSEPGTVALATASFWEGVDLPGQALELVVIARLPFAVPTEPVVVARLERVGSPRGPSRVPPGRVVVARLGRLRKGGRPPFLPFRLPEVVLRLRQGFGRLIRHRNDRGAVVLLAGRVTRRRYGRLVLDSLPPAAFFRGDRWQVAQAVRRHLATEQGSGEG